MVRVVDAREGLVVVDDLFDDEAEELLGELRVEPGLVGEGTQPRDLGLLARGIRGRQATARLELADLLRRSGKLDLAETLPPYASLESTLHLV